jgi:hypothetical protein
MNIKTIISLGSVVAALATPVLAQDNQDRNYPYDVERVERQQAREALGYYGRDDVRDMRRYNDPYTHDLREQRAYRGYGYRGDPGIECWNWRARTFERAREGEFQDDLDYSRCRSYNDGGYRTYRWRY